MDSKQMANRCQKDSKTNFPSVILLPSVCYPSAILLRSLPSAIHSGFLPLVPSVLILAIRGPLGVIFCTQDQQMADWSPTDLVE